MMLVLGLVLLLAGAAWIWGGVILRVGGTAIGLLGAAELVLGGGVGGVVLVSIGGALWLAGQLHHRLRHGSAKSFLAPF